MIVIANRCAFLHVRDLLNWAFNHSRTLSAITGVSLIVYLVTLFLFGRRSPVTRHGSTMDINTVLSVCTRTTRLIDDKLLKIFVRPYRKCLHSWRSISISWGINASKFAVKNAECWEHHSRISKKFRQNVTFLNKILIIFEYFDYSPELHAFTSESHIAASCYEIVQKCSKKCATAIIYCIYIYEYFIFYEFYFRALKKANNFQMSIIRLILPQ